MTHARILKSCDFQTKSKTHETAAEINMNTQKFTVINRAEVQKLLPMNAAIDIMARALKHLAEGQVVMPHRAVMWLPDKTGVLGTMPSYSGVSKVMGLKAITVFPENSKAGYDSHQGLVMLFEAQHGRLLAVIDAGEITAIRTAAVSGVATRLLARPAAGNLVILGSGVQARKHLEAMQLVRKIRRVVVWNPSRGSARRFAESESKRGGLKIEVQESSRADVSGADIICTVTPSLEPVLFGASIPEGAHINAVGACQPHARELDTAAVVKARLFVDSRESALSESGDFLFPKKEGAVGDGHIVGEIGQLVLGEIAGRKSDYEITLFESLGLAIEDLAAAEYIYRQAVEKGIGTEVEL
jgi:ornithine cyclodeaminase/alanine dehydrogenase-like protein (mu-crystallin family)